MSPRVVALVLQKWLLITFGVIHFNGDIHVQSVKILHRYIKNDSYVSILATKCVRGFQNFGVFDLPCKSS